MPYSRGVYARGHGNINAYQYNDLPDWLAWAFIIFVIYIIFRVWREIEKERREKEK